MVHTAIYAYDVQARMASDQAAGLKQAADASVAELRKSLVQAGERDSAAAAGRRDADSARGQRK